MGAQLSLLVHSTGSIGVFSYIDVLQDVHYSSQLNSSGFLKTCKALDPNSEIVIKVFIKPNETYLLKSIHDCLKKESVLLAPLPNVLNYSKIIESARAGYLVRQHMKNNLYDRISERPYLLDIEKKFIIFQLLQALKDIHDLDIVHGDIKLENILVTSWNWVVLTDFASSIKPVYLPDDNPGEFLFYFDTSKRRACYVAPERFNSKCIEDNFTSKAKLEKKMDVFSLGCCIAEILSEGGNSMFNLSQMFKYKNGELDVTALLEQALPNDELAQSLVKDMICIDPSSRLTTEQLLSKYRGTFFPDFFYTFTYDYFRTLATITASVPTTGETAGHNNLNDKLYVADESVNKIYDDFGKICESLQLSIFKGVNEVKSPRDYYKKKSANDMHIVSTNFVFHNDTVLFDSKTTNEESSIMFISFICHCLRNIVTRTAKTNCLEILTAFSFYVSDLNKIDRVVPYIVSSFKDTDPNIQALAVQCLSQIMMSVQVLDPMNENVFVDYLLPRLKKLLMSAKQSSHVRVVIANCFSNFVNDADRFQKLMLKDLSKQSSASLINDLEKLDITNKYTKKLTLQVENIAVILLTDNSTRVKIALLDNILPLCKFFGREKTNDVILSHLITYLNDKNFALRIRLTETIAGVAILLGPVVIQQYILPLLIQTLTDPEELIVVNVLQSLKELCQTGSVSQTHFYDLCETVSPLLLHPNNWIRQFSLTLIAEIVSKLKKAEVYCTLYPILRPYFEFDIDFTMDLMISSCKQPVSRAVYELIGSWSLRATKSLFWNQIESKQKDSFGNNMNIFITKDFALKNYGFNSALKMSTSVVKTIDNKEIPLSGEDKNWINIFHSLGLSEKELWKITVLRGYVHRVARLSSRKAVISNDFETMIMLNSRENPNVMPRNVFFDIVQSEQKNRPILTSGSKKLTSAQIFSKLKQTPGIMDVNGSLIISNKSPATINSNFENIYVHFEAAPDISSQLNETSNENNLLNDFYVTNSYEGSDRSIQKFLDNVEVQYPSKLFKEFGEPVNKAPPSNFNSYNLNSKKVISLKESDTSSVSSIEVTNGGKPMLITGSVSGALKVWDISEVSSGQVFTPCYDIDLASPIVDIAAMPDYECFAVATADGCIKLYRIIYSDTSENKKFNSLKCIRNLMINNSEYSSIPLKISLAKLAGATYLFVLTNGSVLKSYDIQTMSLVHSLENPAIYGSVLTFAIDVSSMTAIMGTIKGVISCWDFRFEQHIKSWTFGDHTPIIAIEIFEVLNGSYIAVKGGLKDSFLTVWDYSKLQCKFVFLTSEKEIPILKSAAVEKDLERAAIKLSDDDRESSCLRITKDIIITTCRSANEVIAINMNHIASSCTLLNNFDKSSQFIPYKVTTTLTYVARKEVLTTNKTKTKLHSDLINKIEILHFADNCLIITADNSGVINVVT